jgi:hypothetical protein
MIRDPSDGSVREKQKVSDTHLKPKTVVETNGLIDAGTSGLPLASTRPENIAKLERSREWLKNYLHRREGT